MTNAIALARNLAQAGLDKQVADAIAEAIVTHSYENLATKADIASLMPGMAEIKGEIKAIAAQMRLLIVLVAGLYVGFAVLFVSNLTG